MPAYIHMYITNISLCMNEVNKKPKEAKRLLGCRVERIRKMTFDIFRENTKERNWKRKKEK